MFSSAVEMLLHIAYREAVSRRHTTLTLEHLLYVLTHDLEGERILAACGADLPRLRRELDAFLAESVEQLSRRDGEGARADPRVPPGPADRRAARAERRDATRCMRATSSPPSCSRAHLRGALAGGAEHQPTRRPQLHLARHRQGAGVRRGRVARGSAPRRRNGPGGAGPPPRDPLGATPSTSATQARAGMLDPADRPHGRAAQRTLEILCRRRKNNPVFVGDAGVGKTALAEGLAHPTARRRTSRAEGPARRRDLRARHRGAARRHALPGRFRGAASRRCWRR